MMKHCGRTQNKKIMLLGDDMNFYFRTRSNKLMPEGAPVSVSVHIHDQVLLQHRLHELLSRLELRCCCRLI